MSRHGHSATREAMKIDAQASTNGRHVRVSEPVITLPDTKDAAACCGSTPAPASSAEQVTRPAPNLRRLWQRADKAWLAIGLIPLLLAILDPAQVIPALRFAAGAILHTGMFIAGAVLAVAWLKASGAEALLSRAFTGRETRMILLGALVGGLAPFCSCEVIPFISALLAVGAPLSAVMAFWLASPLMDPAMFLITAGTLGTGFAVAKTVAAVGLGWAAACWCVRRQQPVCRSAQGAAGGRHWRRAAGRHATPSRWPGGRSGRSGARRSAGGCFATPRPGTRCSC